MHRIEISIGIPLLIPNVGALIAMPTRSRTARSEACLIQYDEILHYYYCII